MKTIQVTLDDELVATVDQVVKKLKTTRSAFTRKALRNAVKQVNIDLRERKHKKGYGNTLLTKRNLVSGSQSKNGVIYETR
jgi:metal-responsive CopG/Arc/MetJ family transcriptional regulator